MLIAEPPRTPYDLHFSVLGIPVRVHPLFWLSAVLLGMNGSKGEPILVALWVLAVFLSVLVHELGHALAARAHGWEPWITLQTFGGLASYRPTYRSPRAVLIITLAGPFAGFLFASLIVVSVRLLGFPVMFQLGGPAGLSLFAGPLANLNTTLLVNDLLWINIFWGIINLLPVYPLDGGQVARTLLSLTSRGDAIRQSLQLSVVTGAAVAVYALLRLNDGYLCMFFAMLAFSSYQTLQLFSGRGRFDSGIW